MAIGQHLETFFGRTVVDFEPGGLLPNPATHAPRVAMVYDGPFETFADAWAQFMETPGAGDTVALVVGNWGNPEDGPTPSEEAIEVVVASAGKLPRLKALFFGDITSEENEMSWIEQGDVSAFWGAFPHLEEFGIRGTNGLQLGPIRHASIRKIAVQTGGLPRAVLRAMIEADLPALEHFEAWIGTDEYGGDSRPADLAALLGGSRFPKLRSLALRNCVWGDDLAIAVAKAPILSRLETLDLSMGTVGDAGVAALAAAPSLFGIKHISVAHHYASDAVIAGLRARGVNVDDQDKQEPDTYDGEENRYVAVSE